MILLLQSTSTPLSRIHTLCSSTNHNLSLDRTMITKRELNNLGAIINFDYITSVTGQVALRAIILVYFNSYVNLRAFVVILKFHLQMVCVQLDQWSMLHPTIRKDTCTQVSSFYFFRLPVINPIVIDNSSSIILMYIVIFLIR